MNERYIPDLHGLIKAEGEQSVADTLGTTVGQLRQYRSGANPLNIDHLYRLSIAYGSGWIVGAVLRIGGKRAKD